MAEDGSIRAIETKPVQTMKTAVVGSREFIEGFAWVDTERCSQSAHPDWRCCLEVSGLDDCGTFIRPYRGDWALVELTNGCLGVLGPDHDFAVGPSDDTEMVLAAWRRGLVAEPGL